MIHVLIVEELSLVRQGLRSLLATRSDLLVLLEAKSGEQAVSISRENKIDVVLMSVQLSGIGGLEATRRIKSMKPEIKLLMLTVPNCDLSPTRLLQFGASGCVSKNVSLEELVTAIQVVYEGQHYLSADVAQAFAMKQLQTGGHSPFEGLTSRELQVASLLARGEKPQGIAEKLCLGLKTVHTYRYRIFEKVGVNTDVKLTHKAILHGLIQLS